MYFPLIQPPTLEQSISAKSSNYWFPQLLKQPPSSTSTITAHENSRYGRNIGLIKTTASNVQLKHLKVFCSHIVNKGIPNQWHCNFWCFCCRLLWQHLSFPYREKSWRLKITSTEDIALEVCFFNTTEQMLAFDNSHQSFVFQSLSVRFCFQTVYSKPQINIPALNHKSFSKICYRFSHLQCMELPEIWNGQTGMILGLNASALIYLVEGVKEKHNETIAMETYFGNLWSQVRSKICFKTNFIIQITTWSILVMQKSTNQQKLHNLNEEKILLLSYWEPL